jgi:hypothetical protein
MEQQPAAAKRKKTPMVRRAVIVWVAVLMSVIPCRAEDPTTLAYVSGNALLQSCQTDRSACRGYSLGIADTMEANGGVLFGRRACLSDPNISAGQITDVVSHYLADHPELRHLAGSPLAATALAEAFPCR